MDNISSEVRQKSFSAHSIAGMAASATAAFPVIYGPNNKPLLPGAHAYQRTAAKREGSMHKWIPKRLFSRQAESMERERIVERSIDLVQSDPHAAGIIENFATTIVGPGLQPHPSINGELLGIGKEEARKLQAQQRAIYTVWSPWADAGGRMGDGEIQFLVQRSILQYGEYLVVLPMLQDTARPYSLACQVIHPLRLKTPTDLMSRGDIQDGVEIGSYGEPVAYWIKKVDVKKPLSYSSDSSANFMRILAKKGHRWNVLHGFVTDDPGQVRGMPFFAPAMKFFRDLSDYLDAELVSNVVTAAFSIFIETGGPDPAMIAAGMADYAEQDADGDDVRYEEMIPGRIMYGAAGQKPHTINPDRPGNTFHVFVKEIKKALALSLNMPYVSLFKDVEGTNYAGMRSAMLDAWRVFMYRRAWFGKRFNQPRYTMLMEEAYLRGDLDIPDFYEKMHLVTSAQWIGTPKGNIEPVKEIQADILAIDNKLDTRGGVITARGGERGQVFDELEEEKDDLESRGLDAAVSTAVVPEDKEDGKEENTQN